MPAVEELISYPSIPDHIWWLADFKPRSQMTPEELGLQHERDRVAYQRMRERMAADPEYREARLEVARRGTKRWQEKNRNDPAHIAARRAQDAKRWSQFGDELNAKKRAAYTGERAETIRARNRDWYSRNREVLSERRKEYRRLNAEVVRAREREKQRLEYAADPKKFNDYMKAWRAKNPTRARLYVRISKHKRRGAPGEFTRDQWLALVRVYGFRCGYCGEVKPLAADHRIPIFRGGTNTIDNIIPACKRCNSRKRTKTEAEFREWLAKEKAKDSSTAKETPRALVVWVPAG